MSDEKIEPIVVRDLEHLMRINFDLAKGFIIKNAAEKKEPAATYLVEESDGTVSVHAFSFTDDNVSKEASVGAMRWYCYWKNARRVSFLSESWMVRMNEGDPLPEGSLENDPRRVDALFVTGEEPGRQAKLTAIITPERVVEKEEFVQYEEVSRGRFSDILYQTVVPDAVWDSRKAEVAQKMYKTIVSMPRVIYAGAVLQGWRPGDHRTPGEMLN